MNFNPMDKEHRAIVIGAMAAADAFGLGRLTNAIEQLEFNDIKADRGVVSRYVYVWGKELDEANPLPR